MASAPKKVKTLAGTTPPPATAGDNPSTPLNMQTVYETILQLQSTVNELIAKFNAHTHTETGTTTAVPGALITGAGSAATNLFTDN